DGSQTAVARISRFLGDRDLILGVDRMDYSKGLPQRFEAIGRLFDNYPEVRERVSFTQIAPPSRSKVEEYAHLREQLDQLAGRINGDYGSLDWIPIRYLARGYPRDELAGLFRMASVCLVTPFNDGMNLVAKEYVAVQNPEDPGVLILSQFAGAAEQLTAALMVNPHDPAHVADNVMRALDMPLDERQSRWRALHEVVNSFDVVWWRREFLSALQRAVERPAQPTHSEA
ncbi:MAG: trehalose-6-phosphate synthase, partial [Caulobacterales bacterium]|nr:trehalose-6-phosphate synthase [Caulobacterales bacterium]